MKVRVKDRYLNVRFGKPRVNAPCYQYLAPGSEIEVDGKLYKGDKWGDSEIDTWLRDAAGNYYWSGGVAHDLPTEDLLSKSVGKKAVFNWMKNLGVQAIWEKYKEKGSSATIAVLDTGYDRDNPELANAIRGEKLFIDALQYPGINLVIDDKSTGGHGTRCASLIGARNQLPYFVGVAPECRLLVGKISINREIRDFDFILQGIEWAIRQRADVISISYAVELTADQVAQYNPKFDQLLEGSEVMVFAAAGNTEGTSAPGERYPASFPQCISVGATNEQQLLSPVTVVSSQTILHAPGEKIEAFDLSNEPTPATGTSFSTPLVAAIAGLAISHLRKKGKPIRRKALLELLTSTGISLPGQPGKRRLDVEKLFDQL